MIRKIRVRDLRNLFRSRKPTSFRKPLHGFTLIELQVVVSIIALLIALLLPVIKGAREDARRVVCQSNLRQIHLALEAYAEDFGGRYPYAGYGMEGFQTVGGCFFYLHNGKDFRPLVNPYIGNAGIMYCPSGGWITRGPGDDCSTPIRFTHSNPTTPWSWNSPLWTRCGLVYHGYFSYSLWPCDGLYASLIDVFHAPQQRLCNERDLVESPMEEIMGQDYAWSRDGKNYPGTVNHPHSFTEVPGDEPQGVGSGWNNLYFDGHVVWRRMGEREVLASGPWGPFIFYR